MQQQNYKKEASVMEGCEEKDLFELSLPFSLPNIGNTLCRMTSMYNNDYVDADADLDTSFVFQIDQSLLIDTRYLLIDKMIGEGAYSTVHTGLWVFFPCFFLGGGGGGVFYVWFSWSWVI